MKATKLLALIVELAFVAWLLLVAYAMLIVK